eukprot:gene3418-2369_t
MKSSTITQPLQSKPHILNTPILNSIYRKTNNHKLTQHVKYPLPQLTPTKPTHRLLCKKLTHTSDNSLRHKVASKPTTPANHCFISNSQQTSKSLPPQPQ